MQEFSSIQYSSILILTAIEEYSKYLMEILINKCGEATSRRDIRNKIYRSHRAKYAYYIGLYVVIIQHSNNYSRTDLHRINEWSKIRKEYLINISQNVKVDNKIVRELETYYNARSNIEKGVSNLTRDAACKIMRLDAVLTK